MHFAQGLIGTVLLAFAVTVPAAELEAPAGARTLVVNGSGEVSVAPDRATARLGVQFSAETAAEAQNKANEAIRRVVAALRKAGVPAARLRTSLLQLEPVYSDQKFSRSGEAGHQLTGFRASNTLQVTLLDTTQLGGVIDAAMEAGANRIEGVSFDLQDDLQARTQALTRAVRNAQSKARAMAEDLGVTLGRVESAQEGGGVVRPVMMSFAGAGLRGAEMSVQPGEITVNASVTITYRLGP